MIIQINLEFCSLIRTFAAIMVANQQESTPMVSFIITYYELPVKLLCECLDIHVRTCGRGDGGEHDRKRDVPEGLH